MRNLILCISIFCLALSGLITFKALNLPEKKPLNSTSQPPTKTHEYTHDVKDAVPGPDKKQDLRPKVNQKLQNTISPLEQKLADKIANSQVNIQTLEKTLKQLEQKLLNKDNASQTDTQPAENTAFQQEHTPASYKNTSQNILEIGKPENTEKSLGLLFSVNFNSGTFVIDDTTKKLIKQSIRPILSMPRNYRLIVEGHTDNLPFKSTAEKTYLRKGNKNLSLYRAKTIAGMFEKEGIPSNRISTIGYGAKRPIASNNTVEGRAKNRRVVVRLIPEEKER